MKARVIAIPLWFVAGWFVGAMVAWMLGLTALIAPAVGVAAAAFVYFDPRNVFWHEQS
jgi:hypothetical protein